MAVSNMNLIRALVSQLKHKPWRAAAADAAAADAAGRPDQNHNIPEISNFGDIIKMSSAYITIFMLVLLSDTGSHIVFLNIFGISSTYKLNKCRLKLQPCLVPMDI